MARLVDGKIVLDASDSRVIDTLLDVEAENAAREQEKKRAGPPKPDAPAVSSG